MREIVKHIAALPNSIRMIVTGPSESGKTQLLLNLIITWLQWERLHLVAPSVDDQRCYNVLKYFNENAKMKNEDDDDSINSYI
jgi:predicted YcjX-like family ATPase